MPLRRPSTLRRRNPVTMTGPAMPILMSKEPNPNLMQMLRNNLISRREKSESILLTSKTLRSCGEKPALILFWSPHKLITQFTLS